MKKLDLFFVCLLLLICIFSGYVAYGMYHHCESCTRLKMHNITLSEKEEIVRNGAYFVGSEIYCVWLGDRSIESILNTEHHEICHYLVEKDYEHFCGE